MLTAQGAPGTLKIRAFNHMTISVSDPKRSLDFYQGLFGMPIQARQGATTLLRVGAGPQFIAVGAAGAERHAEHQPLLRDGRGFQRRPRAQGARRPRRQQGRSHGRRPERRSDEGARAHARAGAGGAPGGTPEIYVGDPDGIVVQLQDPKYCGGGGVLGDVLLAGAVAEEGAASQLKEYSHFTIFVDRRAALQRVLQGRVRHRHPLLPGADGADAGHRSDRAFLMFTGGGGARAGRRRHAAAGEHQPCLPQHGELQPRPGDQGARELRHQAAREPDRARSAPMRHYISMRMENRGGAKEGTPELYFTDPDGILIQMQDVKYCGGGGYLGDSCPPVVAA